MELPNISNYGTADTKNAVAVTIGNATAYFSYETLIGFNSPSTGLVLSENLWGATTAKHLNFISRSAKRLVRAEFEALVKQAVDLAARKSL